MRIARFVAAAATFVALISSTSAMAQAAPAIVVAFQRADTSVPIGPWASIVAALCIALVAVIVFRRQHAGRASPWSFWFVVLATLAAGGISLDAIRAVHAFAPPTVLDLTTSPASIAIGGGFARIDARNATGGSIRITSVTVANPVNGQFVEIPPTTCQPGLILAPGQTCTVQVNTGES